MPVSVRLAVFPLAVIVIAAFVKLCPWNGVPAVAGVPINPLAANWNVDVSVCAVLVIAPNAKRKMRDNCIMV